MLKRLQHPHHFARRDITVNVIHHTGTGCLRGQKSKAFPRARIHAYTKHTDAPLRTARTSDHYFVFSHTHFGTSGVATNGGWAGYGRPFLSKESVLRFCTGMLTWGCDSGTCPDTGSTMVGVTSTISSLLVRLMLRDLNSSPRIGMSPIPGTLLSCTVVRWSSSPAIPKLWPSFSSISVSARRV